MNKAKKAYDEIPYFSAAFSDCSPVRIEAVAKFLGLKAASLKEARVLELGSSYGGNILPFAISHKNAKVVGIDISSHQVAEGNKVAKQIGLENFTLLERNFLHMNEIDIKELGKFDYIIAHGVYSWVSPNVRDALLATIKALLSKDGIAYVSYNTYPGWKSLDILRDFMLFVSSGNDSKEALAHVKSELNFLQDYLKFSLQNQSDVVYKMNQPGDQFIILKLNVDIPYVPFGKLLVGGSGTLGYQRFIVSGLTLGGDVSFGYSQTLGKNVFYFVPVLFRAGWQFSAGKFEFPLSIGIGGAFENYLDRSYFGLALHPDAAAFFRYDRSWSFGLHAGLYILPQWYKNTQQNRTGIIQDIGLTVRYHF